MNRPRRNRYRAGGLLLAVVGLLAAVGVLAGPAVAKDGNHDRISDRWEKRHHLSLTVNQAHRDQDGDHLRNLGEFRAGDNPRDDDSDNDGVMDGEENAGTIASFDAATGKLAINLFGGDTVSGLVTAETEIKCEGGDDSSASASSGESEPGDDHGDHGEEPGDDNGGDDNSGPGSSDSGPGNHGDDGEVTNCTTSDLIPGAVVQQAELELQNGAATFHEVELAHTS
ncbi:MAG TPA: hypothetical protein VK471_07665 [Solirubrobacterales bacterium]|nr:hypothetical protein [Solirubrobacterales bacterium]